MKKRISTPLGIHVHNDSELAVANTIVAVKKGIRLVQGTINGYGERCGKAKLCSIIPNLKLKMGIACITDTQLKKMTEVSRVVSELANLPHSKYLPYVGESGFAHKGGVHVSAIRKSDVTYEHVPPEKVGNRQRVLISDLSGESNILYKAAEFKIDIESKDPKVREILDNLKQLEHQGFQFEGAEGSFEILIKKALGQHKKFFELMGFRVIVEKSEEEGPSISEATIMVRVGDSVEHTAAVGNGPVNALDNAIRKALEKFYPELKEVTSSIIKFAFSDQHILVAYMNHNSAGIIYPAALISYKHILRHLAAKDESELKDLGLAAERKSPIDQFLEKRDEARKKAGLK